MSDIGTSYLIAQFKDGSSIVRQEAKPPENATVTFSPEEEGWVRFAIYDRRKDPILVFEFGVDPDTRKPHSSSLPGHVIYIESRWMKGDDIALKQIRWFIRRVGLDYGNIYNHGRPLLAGFPDTAGYRDSLNSVMMPIEYPRERLEIRDDIPPLEPSLATEDEPVMEYLSRVVPSSRTSIPLHREEVGVPHLYVEFSLGLEPEPKQLPIAIQPHVWRGDVRIGPNETFPLSSEQPTVKWNVDFFPRSLKQRRHWHRHIYELRDQSSLPDAIRAILRDFLGIVEERKLNLSNLELFDPGALQVDESALELYELLDEPLPFLWAWPAFQQWAEEAGLSVFR